MDNLRLPRMMAKVFKRPFNDYKESDPIPPRHRSSTRLEHQPGRETWTGLKMSRARRAPATSGEVEVL